MSQPLTDVLTQRSRQLADEYPFVWLYEVEVPTSPPTRYRLTNYDKEIAFDTTTLGAPLVYTPFPCVQTPVTKNAEGDLPQIQLQVGNDSLVLREILEEHDGLVGQPVVIKLLHLLERENPSSALRFDGQIVACKVAQDRTTWNISALSLAQATLPGQRYIRGHCRFRYGDERCGYDLTNASLSGPYPTCDKTLSACEARGVLQQSLGLPVRHPGRFGGWPGIPRQGRR
jgi:phage-related protein